MALFSAMEKEKLSRLVDVAVKATYEGGKEILKVYESDFAVEVKDDKSPLTLADQNAHNKIAEYLKDTDIPVLSEEGRDVDFAERSEWDYFWLVDPLDGTKEFIKRNGEFTVNIALIHNQIPIAGVIYVPVKNVMYFASENLGSFKKENYKGEGLGDLLNSAEKLPKKNDNATFKVVGSRSHMSEETIDYVNELKRVYGDVQVVSMGSSLKICLVAEGEADVYPRFGPTMEWDTGAGQAIALYAGKEVIDHYTGETLKYNKENLLNNWFIVK